MYSDIYGWMKALEASDQIPTAPTWASPCSPLAQGE
jgi:hypothetical protein